MSPNPDKDYLAMQASYLRCCSSNGFFDTFYDVFLNKSEEIAEKFANTDLSKQKVVLKTSLFRMVANSRNESSTSGNSAGGNTAREEIEKIGKSHSRQQHNIPPAMYDLWLDSLCESVKKHDLGFSPELEKIWREKMGVIINQITAMY